ncbi:MAG: RNA polymerase sigma factor [Deltaproteobacteria bacterium]|nr:MAG: RNA polymerase sigma factor [Deltaproteobacteria bacterium]
MQPALVADISDAALMARLARGDSSALGPLFMRYGKLAGSLMLRVEPSLSREQADDLVQEVFLTLLDTAPRYRESQRLKAWICGIAVRKARGWRRKHWLRRGLLERFTPERQVEALPSQRAEARQSIDHALRALPAGQREVLVLHVVEGLSGQEVAETLGLSENAVWVRLHRARKTLSALGGEA